MKKKTFSLHDYADLNLMTFPLERVVSVEYGSDYRFILVKVWEGHTFQYDCDEHLTEVFIAKWSDYCKREQHLIRRKAWLDDTRISDG